MNGIVFLYKGYNIFMEKYSFEMRTNRFTEGTEDEDKPNQECTSKTQEKVKKRLKRFIRWCKNSKWNLKNILHRKKFVSRQFKRKTTLPEKMRNN